MRTHLNNDNAVTFSISVVQTGDFAGADVTSQTHMVFKNMSAILKESGCTMNDVVKSTVLLADMSDFATVNEIYAQNFSHPFPARSTFAVKTLPKNAYDRCQFCLSSHASSFSD